MDDAMNDNMMAFEPSDEALLTFEVSDEVLEAAGAATPRPVAALSMASTAVILILCCTNG